MDNISILVVDDHAMVRMGLVSLLSTVESFSIVGEADNGEKAIQLAIKHRPDIILMDIVMPQLDGIEATRKIMSMINSSKVILLTSEGTTDNIAQGINVGAKGAILKSSDFSSLVTTIMAVANGDDAISPEIKQLMSEDPPIPSLSPRQQQILDSIVRGLYDRDIANQLGISVYTVKEHINSLFAKIGAANRTEAVAIALRKHLLKI